MSRAGDLTAVVLDVGPSMSTKLASGKSHLETAVKAIDLFVQQKILHSKKDRVALITFGDNETDNSLADDDQYQNICVRNPLATPDLELLRFIENEIQPGDQPTDFVDALVVALDCLITGGEGKKGAKKIYMFTDAGSPVNDSSLNEIIEGIKAHDIDLRIIGVGIDEDEEEDDEAVVHMTDVQKENVKIIKRIVDAVEGETYSFASALDMLSQFRKRTIRPTTTFRGCLNIAELKIPVFLYTEEKREPRPRLSKLSALVDLDPTDEDSAKVEREVTYHKLDEDETEVSADDRIKGYKYGRTIVPWEKMHEENLALRPDKELSVICFTHKDNVPRHHQLDPLLCVLPAHDDETAAGAIACLAQALHEMDSVAIVRYVFRNKAAPKLGMIFPTISDEYKGLYYVSLPFREDIRPYEFASLATNPNANFDKEQRSAVEAVIQNMDLMKGYIDEDGDEVEAYEPQYTFNPGIQMFYQCMHHRAMNPNDPLPPLDPTIAEYIKPSEKVLKDSDSARRDLVDKFPLTVRQKKGKKTGAELFGAGEQPAKKAKESADAADTSFSVADLMQPTVTQVGSTTPVEDYKALVADKTEDKLVPASKQMMGRIQDLVDLYTGGDVGHFTAMVKTLREELLPTEPEMFNTFLRELVGEIKQHMEQRRCFWDELKNNNLTLISSSESAQSDVPQMEADSFFSEAAAPAATTAPQAEADEEEDLLDEL